MRNAGTTESSGRWGNRTRNLKLTHYPMAVKVDGGLARGEDRRIRNSRGGIMREISVEVQNDHLERMTNVPKPILAVAELMWNGLDADATQVAVVFVRNQLQGLQAIEVTDNGTGIEYSDAVPAFKNLGGSIKRDRPRSRKAKRLVHGSAGKGRFKAFSLGKTVTWDTCYGEANRLLEYRIEGHRSNLGTFRVTDPALVNRDSTGTVVRISGIEKNFRSLEGPPAAQEMVGHFALYLRQYPDVRIIYDGERVDPSTVEENTAEYPLEGIATAEGKPVKATVLVIEWKRPVERSLYLCDANGLTLSETSANIHASGFNFTAYVKSNLIRELDDKGALGLEELQPDLKMLLDAARDKLKEHFRTRAAELSASLVEEWKKEEIYPYAGEPRNWLEQTERQVFDVLALNVHAYLPDFPKSDTRSRRFSFRLLKQTLEDSPRELQRIIQEVLELPAEKRQDLADLLERTSLAAIINASKLVTDRLEFLKGLELLVFDEVSREQLKERTQLHRILAENTWIFGEEFSLSVDDQSLTEVLRKHLKLLGREELVSTPVTRVDGSIGIVDMMLSRLIPQPRAEEREHLVLELKRPKEPISSKVAAQIESYAFAVANDERFKDTRTKWVFWAVSNEVDETVRRRARQRNRPEGMIHDDEEGRYSVWVRTWGQLIEACRGRLEFFRNHLNYAPDKDSALAHLRKVHEKLLPAVFKK
jgi:hypothetical protein